MRMALMLATGLTGLAVTASFIGSVGWGVYLFLLDRKALPRDYLDIFTPGGIPSSAWAGLFYMFAAFLCLALVWIFLASLFLKGRFND